MKKPVLSLFVIALFALSAFAAPDRARHIGHQRGAAPQKLMGITENGKTVTLQLENGKTVDLNAHRVHVRHAAVQDKSTAAKGTSLSRITPTTPAAVTLIYRKDGTVKRAQIEVFESSTALSAFLQKSPLPKQ